MRALVTSICLVLVIGACAEDESAQTSPESSRIRFQVSGEQEEIAVYEALVEAYESANPEAQVRLIPVADKGDHLTRLATAFAGGKPPDVFLVNFREYSQFVACGAIEAIGPRLDDLGISLDDYYPPPVEAFTYDEQIQCMPQNISSLVVYYNRTLFKQAGLSHPKEGWMWDDFRQTAMRLTDGKVHGLGVEPNVIRIAPFVWSNGGELVDDDDAPTRFTLDEPASREALEFIVSLVRDDRVVPSAEDVEAQDLETRFMAGKLGMLLSSWRDTPAFREVTDLDWDIASLPVGVEPAGILHSDAYCVSRGTDVEAAFDFVAYATGEEGETLTALGGRTVPSLISVSTSGAFLDPTSEPKHSQVFLDAIPVIRRTPVLPTWPEIESIAEEFLTRAFYEDGYTIDQFLEDLDKETRPLFEEGAAPLTLAVTDLGKTYRGGRGRDDVVALDGIDLEVADGELVTVVGPSGSGKTTLLRCIAGLTEPDRGSIEIGEIDVTSTPPGARDIAMVFQEYALFPHLTVRENVAFGMKARKTSPTVVAARVERATDMLALHGTLDRRPAELSGGERQRVALARAVVREPTVFLLDEPLSDLDAELRTRTRAEIRALQRHLGTATVYVTHDQVEAMTVGDRIAVLRAGAVEQVGAPTEIYDQPATAFVATFIGLPPMNVFPAELLGPSNGAVMHGLRPEAIDLGSPEGAPIVGSAVATEVIGSEAIVHLDSGGSRLLVKCRREQAPAAGAEVGLRFVHDSLYSFDAEGRTL